MILLWFLKCIPVLLNGKTVASIGKPAPFSIKVGCNVLTWFSRRISGYGVFTVAKLHHQWEKRSNWSTSKEARFRFSVEFSYSTRLQPIQLSLILPYGNQQEMYQTRSNEILFCSRLSYLGNEFQHQLVTFSTCQYFVLQFCPTMGLHSMVTGKVFKVNVSAVSKIVQFLWIPRWSFVMKECKN